MFGVVFKNLGEIGGNILSVSGNSLELAARRGDSRGATGDTPERKTIVERTTSSILKTVAKPLTGWAGSAPPKYIAAG